MPEAPEGRPGHDDQECGLILSLQAAASHVRASDGREVSFTKAVLTVRNACESNVIGLSLHATLGQEGGTVQDVTHALSGPASLPAGGGLSWDVYDLLLPAHPGTASKIHMFGYRAVLNWRFDLAVWAEYQLSAGSPPVRTSVSRWALRWSVPDSITGAVVLAIEEGKG
jgi:hypothetical protein